MLTTNPAQLEEDKLAAERDRVMRLAHMVKPGCGSIITEAIKSGASPEETALKIEQHRQQIAQWGTTDAVDPDCN